MEREERRDDDGDREPLAPPLTPDEEDGDVQPLPVPEREDLEPEMPGIEPDPKRTFGR